MLSEINACVIVPTYNNGSTLKKVIQDLLLYDNSMTLIAVNDGSTDDTSKILAEFQDQIEIIDNDVNKGKGYSLQRGFRKAIELGFDNAISIDSDGQHFPKDLSVFLENAKENPGSVLMGSRNMKEAGAPGKSSFGNKFSNFWFTLETWISLPDTQTGYRLYPLGKMKKMKFFTKRFEFEIEIIVRLAWKGVQFVPVPIKVSYDIPDRVSHFRPFKDFARISLLNSVLVLGALFYYYPKKLFSLNTLRVIKAEAIKPEESNLRKAFSIGFGFFMGIVPIWGFQLLVGIPLAILFRMNKVLFIAAANISIPPMIPLIVYSSLLIGQQVVVGEIDHSAMLSFGLEDIKDNFLQYVIGAVLLATLAFFVGFLLSFGLLKIFRKEPKSASS